MWPNLNSLFKVFVYIVSSIDGYIVNKNFKHQNYNGPILTDPI